MGRKKSKKCLLPDPRFEWGKKPKFKYWTIKEPTMTKEQLKDIAVRAGKTFLQAFIASLAVATQTDFSNFKAVIIAAASAGVSAVWNSLLAMNKGTK